MADWREPIVVLRDRPDDLGDEAHEHLRALVARSAGAPVDETVAWVRLLMDGHVRELYRVARRLTGRHDEAEDLVQETLMRAWRARATFRPGGNARAWVFAIMMNARAKAFRKARRAPPVADIDGEELSEQFDRLECQAARYAEDPEEAVLNAQPSEEVEAALQQVPEHYRSAFLLAKVKGFSYQEISRMLDLPLGTVRSRIARGRRLLADALRDYCVRSGVCRVLAPVTTAVAAACVVAGVCVAACAGRWCGL